jgi:sugar phosphate isomerase/epimerase
MEFNVLGDMFGPMDREYHSDAPGNNPVTDEPVLMMNEIGTTVNEIPGQFDLLHTVKADIKKGVSRIELSTGMGGPTSAAGPEAYGKEAREALRELAKVNKVEFTSVHVSPQINGLSGFNPQQGTFSEDYQKMAIEEIEKATRFSAEVTGGSAIVVHQSEFERPVSEQEWASETLPDGTKRYKFLSNLYEPQRAIYRVVDRKTGQVKGVVQKNMILERPKWMTADREYDYYDEETQSTIRVKPGDYVDLDGKKINNIANRVPMVDDKGNFIVERITWDKLVDEYKKYKEDHPNENLDLAVYAYRVQAEMGIARTRGQAAYYSQGYSKVLEERKEIIKALNYYKKLRDELGEEEFKKKFKLNEPRRYSQLIPSKTTDPVEELEKALLDINRQIEWNQESGAHGLADAMRMEEELKYITTIKDYALEQSETTLGIAGISAYEQTKNNPKAKKPIFIAVENWDPNSFGSHPDELIELISRGRKKMVQLLTEKKLKIGEQEMENPYFRGVSKKEAEKLAEQHIKVTLDTEHLALWRKKFMPLPGESREQTNKRFESWYLEQIGKLAKSNIIGHVHFVDSIEGGHLHLPAGQGELPLKEVIKKLKEAGFKGTIVSEGHGENRRYGADRQITSAWDYLGARMHRSFVPGSPMVFHDSPPYSMGMYQPPLFIAGAYAPSNDWKLWSEVPLE